MLEIAITKYQNIVVCGYLGQDILDMSDSPPHISS